MGIKLYNKMPTKIKQLDSFRDLKKIKVIFTGSPFYFLLSYHLISL